MGLPDASEHTSGASPSLTDPQQCTSSAFLRDLRTDVVKAPDARDSGNGDKVALVSQSVAGARRRDPKDSQAWLRAPTLQQMVSKGGPPRPTGWPCVPARHQPPCSASSAPSLQRPVTFRNRGKWSIKHVHLLGLKKSFFPARK